MAITLKENRPVRGVEAVFGTSGWDARKLRALSISLRDASGALTGA